MKYHSRFVVIAVALVKDQFISIPIYKNMLSDLVFQNQRKAIVLLQFARYQ